MSVTTLSPTNSFRSLSLGHPVPEADIPEDHDEDPGKKKSKKKKKKKSKARPCPIEIQRLFAQLQLVNQRAVSTEELTRKGFNFTTADAQVQHDVHELITKLLELIE